MNLTNNMTARESLKIAAELMFNAFKDDKHSVDEVWNWIWERRPAQAHIRLEVELNNSSNSFKFGLTEKQSNSNNVQFTTERRLDQQDTLVVNQFAICVGKVASEDDTLWEPRTYGNIVDFGLVNGAVIDQTFFSHGWYNLMVNNTNIMPYRPLKDHHYRGITQQTAALGASSPNDQFMGSEDGFVTQESNLLLIGNKGYMPYINFPTSLAFASAEPGIRAVLDYSGILFQNSTILS